MWQDQVLEAATAVLSGKELGIVLTIGVSEKEYQRWEKKSIRSRSICVRINALPINSR